MDRPEMRAEDLACTLGNSRAHCVLCDRRKRPGEGYSWYRLVINSLDASAELHCQVTRLKDECVDLREPGDRCQTAARTARPAEQPRARVTQAQRETRSTPKTYHPPSRRKSRLRAGSRRLEAA